MDYKYLQNIIEQGESSTVEFKSSFNDAAIETKLFQIIKVEGSLLV